MTFQEGLLRLLSSRLLGDVGQRSLRGRLWTIERGEGAGLKVVYPQNHEYIRGSSERPVQNALATRLHSGDVFYDVGANVGFFSIIAARLVGSEGCVYSFEPVEENIRSIRENAKANKLENMRSFEVAVGRMSGNEDLLLTEWNGGASLSTSVVKPAVPVSTRNVRVVALDDFIQAQDLRAPTLVKIDVEGSELDVVQGMSRTIVTSRPILLYEIDDGNKNAFSRRWQELDQLVAGFGYRILHLEESYPTLRWNVGHSLAVPVESPDAG